MMKRSRKQRTDSAIAYAIERRWEEAAAENRSLLTDFPDDLEAANRLGKALTETGDLAGAAAAYGRSMEIDPANMIARRNLSRIEELRGQEKAAGGRKSTRTRRAAPSTSPAAAAAANAASRPYSLIEESGRSVEFTLIEPDMAALEHVSAGDPATLTATPRGVAVQGMEGVALGQIEASAALRLRRLMAGGNQYAVLIRRVAEDGVTVYVRETHRAPELADEPSFLPPAAAIRRTATRAYTKTSVLRYETGGGPSDDDDTDTDSWEPRSRSDDDDDEMDGFGDATLQDDDDDDLDGPVADDDDEDDDEDDS